MKFRPQRGSLADAMNEVQECEPTLEGLQAAMRAVYGGFAPTGEITVKPYGSGYDSRIGWNTHVVLEDGKACGFTDGPLTHPDAAVDAPPSRPHTAS